MQCRVRDMSNEGVKQFVVEMDREMSKKSFKYFFTEILGFHYRSTRK